MAKKLELLKLKRKQFIDNIARINQFVNQNSASEVCEKVYYEFKARFVKLPPIFEQFEAIQNEIELMTEFNPAEEEIRTKVEDEYYSLYAQIQQKIQEFKPESSNRTPTPASSVPIHFPMMNLPKFKGEYHLWPEFRDSFLSLIGDNPALSNIQKFYHLRACLAPTVLETIKSIPVNNENFEFALKQLSARYGKEHLIASNHVNAILEFPRILKESGAELRNLHNCAFNNLEALKNLGIAIQHWDLMLIPIIVAKLDPVTMKEWEKFSITKPQVRFQELLLLMNNRAEFLERMEEKHSKHNPNKRVYIPTGKAAAAVYVQSQDHLCKICNSDHSIFRCEQFMKLSVKDRIKRVKDKKLCLNCLKGSHFANQCKSSHCKKCGKAHNTLLHVPQESKDRASVPKADEATIVATTQTSSRNHSQSPCQVILPTAVIWAEDVHNKWHKCRVLLDSGAMSNFISWGLCRKLGLPVETIKCSIRGVGESFQNVQQRVQVTVSPMEGERPRFEMACLVLDKITTNLPLISFDKDKIQIPENITLADPAFSVSSPIDMLLGSSVFWELLEKGRVRVPNTRLILQETKLGWIVGGPLTSPKGSRAKGQEMVNCTSISQVALEEQVRKFWEIEEVEIRKERSPDEQFCEESFVRTHQRDANGHFIVKVPFKSNVAQLGQSRHLAVKRFEHLEKRRFSKDPSLRVEYSKIMNEYISMGHMREIDDQSEAETASYYIPHHVVIRRDSLTTKVRVVFDASMATTSGLSLNSVQYIGPTIQNDLFSILLNFRIHKYVMSGDISKMYRMVWLHKDHRAFHRIFWRDAPEQPLKCYELQTVTFGTASAPFLAVRCLHQLAIENKQKYPKAARLIQNNFYADDLLFGAESLEELIGMQHEITTILSAAGFHLRKWLSNDKAVYTRLKLNADLECNTLQIGEKEHQTLGIAWNTDSDQFLYRQYQFHKHPMTKRKILSELSKVFDPLGLLGPIVVVGKLLIQSLWQERIPWDDPVPPELFENWSSYQGELEKLQLIKIDRKVLIENHQTFDIHGFCDASQRAYGACIFVRSEDKRGNISTKLLCSKGRVAPLKTLSLPRLELSAALLLAQLTQKVLAKFEVQPRATYYWSDSTITLAWIRGDPSRWKTFVSNRVGEIQRLTEINNWHHVSSSDNPADILSRGATVDQLMKSQIWWFGPYWMSNKNLPFNQDFQMLNEIPEERVVVHSSTEHTHELVNRYSSFDRLLRITAYCIRFGSNCRPLLGKRKQGELTVDELNFARVSLLRSMQQEAFAKEYHNLAASKPVHPKSRLLALNPFLDNDNLIRVGGRLDKTHLTFESKHPVILAPSHPLTKLIVKKIHNDNFHCGPTALLAFIRQRYWPIDGRNLAKGMVRGCRVCFLAKPKSSEYLMGQLPECRATRSFPFQNVGVDYAGPVLIKDRKTRNPKILKAYICLYICMATKAIHLECASELSTEAFILCLRRFISRRGKPSNIYSDNAKNFVGASAEIRNIYKYVKQNFQDIERFLVNQEIEWHFIPARSPSFGGIWEAGIKSVKSHLYKTMKNIKFNFEELSTLLCQIEAVLNSRPLTPLSTDPADFTPLTPGHFLIGRGINQHLEISNPSLIPASRLKQYRQLEGILNHFWKRWSLEYIHQLQSRSKWTRGAPADAAAIQVGKLVLLQEPTHPLQWPLGRITELHPGDDGVVRVVSVKVRGGIVKRGVAKICVLPEEF